MIRYIWTLIAGFVLGLYAVFFAVVHIRAIRKPVIDMAAKVLVDWIYGTRPDELRRGYQRSHAMPYRDYSQMRRPQAPTRSVNLMVDTHDETVQLLKAMQDIVDEYGHFTVADLKSALGRRTDFQDSKYGWKKVDGVLYFSQDEDDKSGWLVTTKELAEVI